MFTLQRKKARLLMKHLNFQHITVLVYKYTVEIILLTKKRFNAHF